MKPRLFLCVVVRIIRDRNDKVKLKLVKKKTAPSNLLDRQGIILYGSV